MTVVPSTVTLAALGHTLQLNTTVLDQSGRAIPGVSILWRSGEESVANVDTTGLVTAIGNGDATITATVTGTSVSGVAAVTVAQQPRAIGLSPGQGSFRALGDTVRLTAMVLDANDHVVENVVLDWVSSDASVVSVDDAGLVTAIGEGTTSVVAMSGPAVGSADFSVEQEAVAVQLSPTPDTLHALGSTVQLTPMGLDANGHVTRSNVFVWTSADESVATVNDAGLITAVGNGSTDITAALQDGSASASVGVTVAQRAQTVRISEPADALTVGDRYQLSATAHDGNQHLVADASLEWSSSDESVATVHPNGLLSARGAGSVEITAIAVGSDAIATITLLVRAPLSERDILVKFYNTTGGPNWERKLYWLTDFPLSAWDGLATDNRDGLVVTGIGLHSNNLTGQMPSGLVGLANLESLDLSFNNLTGSIPPELGNLGALHYLRLDFNNFTGSIPPELGDLAGLESLWLAGNNLTGSIPPELGSLVNVRAMDLRRNNLMGSIPPELGNLANIRLLSLGHNGLTGSIPAEIGNLDSLGLLNLYDNNLTGPIPAELGNLNSLVSLDLSNNNLTGAIPSGLGSLAKLGRLVCISRPPLGVCELSRLDLSNNDLTGSIPPELSNLDSLPNLNLSRNRLTGSIPPELGNLRSLESLSLSSNDLTGSIPPELGSLGRLKSLSLYFNDLTGPIPPELGNLHSLESLSLDFNDLSGPIPPDLGGLGRLESLYLGGNDLRGAIPPDLGNLGRLKSLYLFSNNLTGSIPSELGNLDNLETLALYRNDLTGPIPPELGSLSNLKWLDLRETGLTGEIPQEFVNLELETFRWQDTQLCAPANEAFQIWLRSIQHHSGGATCSSTGGS